MCSTHKQNKYCRGFRKGVFVVTSKTITKSFLRDESKVDRNQSIQNITVLAVPAQTSVSSCTGRGTWKRHKKVMPSIHPSRSFVRRLPLIVSATDVVRGTRGLDANETIPPFSRTFRTHPRVYRTRSRCPGGSGHGRGQAFALCQVPRRLL